MLSTLRLCSQKSFCVTAFHGGLAGQVNPGRIEAKEVAHRPPPGKRPPETEINII